jgi:4-diphosphocytidyl-2-C-methyl-D-erythritol kinase
MTAKAYAKINLTLEVYGKRADGYHALRSVVLPITLADTIDIVPAEAGKILTNSVYAEDDLAVKALRALDHHCPTRPLLRSGLSVTIKKEIPEGGGLGGGSADAAASLLAANEIWNLNLSLEELASVGAKVGSDVPALVLAQSRRAAVLMEGRGEKVSLLSEAVTKLPELQGFFNPNAQIVLANPGVHSSTAQTYAQCTEREGEGQGQLLFTNDLQQAACSLHPEIALSLAALVAAGAKSVMMSGSGATVFGLAEDLNQAQAICSTMQAIGCRTWITQPLLSTL